MNLESIKDRQERINKKLDLLLKDTINVIELIVGGNPKPDCEITTKEFSGFLEELSKKQDATEFYIGEIEHYILLLRSKTLTQEATIVEDAENVDINIKVE